MDDVAIDKVTHFYLDPWGPLLRAMCRAEGPTDEHFITAVKCSFPAITTFPEALARAAKTLRNRAVDYHARDLGALCMPVVVAKQDPWTGEPNPRGLRVTPKFIEFLAARWAPEGAANDPDGLNAHWDDNVKAVYRSSYV